MHWEFIFYFVAFAAVIAYVGVRARISEIRQTRSAFECLPIKIPITALYLDHGQPSFVYFPLQGGGQMSRTVRSYVPDRIRGPYHEPKHIIFYDADHEAEWMIIRKPNTNEAWWVEQGHKSPFNSYDTRYVLEFHLAPGNVPHAD